MQEYRVQEDPEKAFSFWLTAAKAGNLEAMSQVANYYDGTFSVPNLEVDYKQAVSWYAPLSTPTRKPPTPTPNSEP